MSLLGQVTVVRALLDCGERTEAILDKHARAYQVD